MFACFITYTCRRFSVIPDITEHDEILFLKSIVIPSISPRLKFGAYEDKRYAWMEEKAMRLSLSTDKVDELMDRFSTVKSLAEAEVKLEKLGERQRPQSPPLTGDGCFCTDVEFHFDDFVLRS